MYSTVGPGLWISLMFSSSLTGFYFVFGVISFVCILLQKKPTKTAGRYIQ